MSYAGNDNDEECEDEDNKYGGRVDNAAYGQCRGYWRFGVADFDDYDDRQHDGCFYFEDHHKATGADSGEYYFRVGYFCGEHDGRCNIFDRDGVCGYETYTDDDYNDGTGLDTDE